MPTVLLVIAPAVFRDEEYFEPKVVLESRGANVLTASTQTGLCQGKLGMSATADMALTDVDPTEIDAIAFIGGAGARIFFDDLKAHELARNLAVSDRVVAAICIAPSILAHADLLSGRKATSYPSQEHDLVEYGAIYTGAPVEIDGHFITANGPDAANGFGHAIADALGLQKS